MKVEDFEFKLPEALIAQAPVQTRDQARLLVLDRAKGISTHTNVSLLADHFQPGDVLALNNTKVFPARLYANKDKSDAKVEVFLLRELENDLWEAMVKPARKVRIGNKLLFNKEISCDVIDNTVSGGRVLRFEYKSKSLYPFIDKCG